MSESKPQNKSKYKCDSCDAKFYDSNDLEIHMKICHSGFWKGLLYGLHKDSMEMKWYQSEPPNIDSYLDNRFKPAVAWYNKKASDNLLRFHLLQVMIIIAGVLVPIINLIPALQFNDTQLLSAILGGIIVGATSVLQLTKSQESWLIFRKTAESLKREYQLFSHHSGNYSDENLASSSTEAIQAQRDRIFVYSAEIIMTNENVAYIQNRSEKSSEVRNA